MNIFCDLSESARKYEHKICNFIYLFDFWIENLLLQYFFLFIGTSITARYVFLSKLPTIDAIAYLLIGKKNEVGVAAKGFVWTFKESVCCHCHSNLF